MAANQTAYAAAAEAIREGRAEARALWVLVSDEHQRDGYWLKPMPWEGPGEYQHVSFASSGGNQGLVRLPEGQSLPTTSPSRPASS